MPVIRVTGYSILSRHCASWIKLWFSCYGSGKKHTRQEITSPCYTPLGCSSKIYCDYRGISPYFSEYSSCQGKFSITVPTVGWQRRDVTWPVCATNLSRGVVSGLCKGTAETPVPVEAAGTHHCSLIWHKEQHECKSENVQTWRKG